MRPCATAQRSYRSERHYSGIRETQGKIVWCCDINEKEQASLRQVLIRCFLLDEGVRMTSELDRGGSNGAKR